MKSPASHHRFIRLCAEGSITGGIRRASVSRMKLWSPSPKGSALFFATSHVAAMTAGVGSQVGSADAAALACAMHALRAVSPIPAPTVRQISLAGPLLAIALCFHSLQWFLPRQPSTLRNQCCLPARLNPFFFCRYKMHRIGEAMHSAPLRLDQQEGREGGELSERSICELRALAASGRDLAELLPLLDGLVSLIRHGPDERSDQKENRSEKFPSNQEESRWGGVVRLMQLESEVLAKLWPAERVVCGQMVCRSLRANLRLSKHVVLKARKKCSVLKKCSAERPWR
jgi:hypothetical protein